MTNAKLTYEGQELELPVHVGTEQEAGIDISPLRAKTGAITFDPGYGNTGSCKSAITFIDGEKGILRYRGYSIEQLAEKASFLEVAYLLINGSLPSKSEYDSFVHDIVYHTMLREDMKKFFEGFTPQAHPMAIMASMVITLSAYYDEDDSPETLNLNY